MQVLSFEGSSMIRRNSSLDRGTNIRMAHSVGIMSLPLVSEIHLEETNAIAELHDVIEGTSQFKGMYDDR